MALLVIADDLTGGADAGVRFARAGLATRLLLDPATDPAAHPGSAQVVVVDTDGRRLTPAAARVAVRDVARRGGRIFKKVDSLLRGPVAAELAGLLDAVPDALVLLAPALPAAGRTTVDGVQLVDGTPLHRADGAWAAEPGTPPEDVTTLLAPLGVTRAGLAEVRGGRLASTLDSATTPVLLCDAETDDDLAAIVHAGLACGRRVCWAGTAGLAGALASALTRDAAAGSVAPRPDERISFGGRGPDGPYLAVIGSATPTALAQADQLAARGARLFSIPAGDLAGGRLDLADRIRTAVGGADTVVRVDGGVDPAATDLVAAGLAAVTAPAAARSRLLVLTGGATARGVLAGAGVTGLWLLAEPEPGVVVGAEPGTGRITVTKAGSFGDPRTLVRAVEAVRHTPKEPTQ